LQALVLHAVGAQELAAARVELVRMERVERDLAKLQAALKASRGRCKVGAGSRPMRAGGSGVSVGESVWLGPWSRSSDSWFEQVSRF
jgi:hypothetical protein